MELYPDLKSYLRVPFGSATCIKLTFGIDREDDNGMMMMISGVENVVPERPIPPLDWHDSVRVDIAQEGHPHIISLNMRFVESQHLDPDVPQMTRAAVFSIKEIALLDTKNTTINGKRVHNYHYHVKLKHYQGCNSEEES
jgi:hypothetical protein